jgi:hypothetical protein
MNLLWVRAQKADVGARLFFKQSASPICRSRKLIVLTEERITHLCASQGVGAQLFTIGEGAGFEAIERIEKVLLSESCEKGCIVWRRLMKIQQRNVANEPKALDG